KPIIITAAKYTLEGVPHREVGRSGISSSIGIPLPVHCYAIALVVAGTAKIRGIDQCRPCGIEPGHEYIGKSMESGKEGVVHREVGRSGSASNIGIPLTVHCYAIAMVVAGTAKIRRIDQCRPCGIEPGHEYIGKSKEGGKEGVVHREVGRASSAGDIGIPLSV